VSWSSPDDGGRPASRRDGGAGSGRAAWSGGFPGGKLIAERDGAAGGGAGGVGGVAAATRGADFSERRGAASRPSERSAACVRRLARGEVSGGEARSVAAGGEAAARAGSERSTVRGPD